VQALKGNGITRLFPIQAKTYEFVAKGRDIIGRARTGSGKTLSFALPVIERLISNKAGKPASRCPHVVIIAPTRELARQVHDVCKMLADAHGLSTICVYGQTAYQPQESAFRSGVSIVVGTPGRLKDHLERGNMKLDNIQFFILDEADEMLNIGFKDDIEKILEYIPKYESIDCFCLLSYAKPTDLQDSKASNITLQCHYSWLGQNHLKEVLSQRSRRSWSCRQRDK